MLKERKKILLSISILFLLINIYSIHGLEGLNVFNDDLQKNQSHTLQLLLYMPYLNMMFILKKQRQTNMVITL